MTSKTELAVKLGTANMRIKHLEREVFRLKNKLDESQLEIGLLNKKLNPVQYADLSHQNSCILKLRDVIEYKYKVDISIRNRHKEVVFARHLFHYWLYYNTKMSVVKIGNIFGFDHSSISHSKQAISDLLSYDKQVIKDYADICLEMNRQNYNEDEIVINPS
jgi:chromosomal replication initiation ATPase DnaA